MSIILVFVLLFALSSTVIYRIAVAARACTTGLGGDTIDPRADFSVAQRALREHATTARTRATSTRAGTSSAAGGGTLGARTV